MSVRWRNPDIRSPDYPRPHMPKLTLLGASLMMFIPGILYRVAPQFMLDVPAIRLQSVNDHHLVRAAYGGGFRGIASPFALGAFRPKFEESSLLAVVLLLFGFAIGRIYSIVVDGVPHVFFLGVLAAELSFATSAALALRR